MRVEENARSSSQQPTLLRAGPGPLVSGAGHARSSRRTRAWRASSNRVSITSCRCLEFRDWLVEIRNDPTRRLARRRNGRVTITKKGVFVPGPFNMATRHEILDRLMELQSNSEMVLIRESEVERIRELWVEDVIISAERNVEAQRTAATGGA